MVTGSVRSWQLVVTGSSSWQLVRGDPVLGAASGRLGRGRRMFGLRYNLAGGRISSLPLVSGQVTSLGCCLSAKLFSGLFSLGFLILF